MEDKAIVALYWARNERAIHETRNKYGAYCQAIARRVLRSHEDAEECVDDAWLAAWNAMPPHRPAMLGPFLGKLTRRISLKRWHMLHAKKRGGGQVTLVLEELAECLPDPHGLEQALEETALAAAIDRFLSALPEEERRVFVLRYWHLFSITEIALRLGCGQGRIKSMLFRTRIRLQAALRKEGFLNEH